MKKRVLSLALCLVLVVGLFSGLTVNASAGRLDDPKKEIAEKLIKEKIEQLKEEFEIPDLNTDAILSSFATAATSGDFGENNCLHWEVSTGVLSGKTLTIVASSLGGGRIMVVEMNGLRANFSGDLPTLIVQNRDQPGHVSEVTSMLAHKGVNIATMQLYRDYPGGNAVMIIETDKAVPPEGIAWLERSEGITRVTFVDAEKAR